MFIVDFNLKYQRVSISFDVALLFNQEADLIDPSINSDQDIDLNRLLV